MVPMAPMPLSIAVLGITGAGKSTFIRTITGREDIIIGKGLKSRAFHPGTHLSLDAIKANRLLRDNEDRIVYRRT
jgi:ABC-type phosphate/phosphonate transport system ATPase subunit